MGKPTLLPSVETYNGQIHDLMCNFTGRPKINITWIYADSIKGVTRSVHHDSSGLTWTVGYLNITSVPKICGAYKITCIGENEFGRAEQSTSLKVTGESIMHVSIYPTNIRP